MILRKLRLQRGWSQSELADMAGVTARTIQRIERGHRPSMETSKALAAVFEVEFSVFQPEEPAMQEPAMNERVELKPDEQEALLYGRRVKEFYEALITYGVLAVVFLVIFHGEPVVYIIFAGLGVALIVQGLIAFEVISFLKPNWEKKFVEKKLGRKL